MSTKQDVLEYVHKRFFDLDQNPTEDVFLDKVIANYITFIENYTNRKADATTITDEYHDGTGSSILYPYWGAIASVENLYVDYSRQFTSSSLIDSSKYLVLPSDDPSYIQLIDSHFENVRLCIKIDYTTTSWNDDLIWACGELTVRVLERKNIGSGFDTSLTTFGGQMLMYRALQIPNDILAVLESNRRFLLPQGKPPTRY